MPHHDHLHLGTFRRVLLMGVGANVQIQALKDLRIAICRLVEAARSSLGEADADLNRHTFWLGEDRQRYWAGEIRKRQEKLRAAKMVLLEKKLQKTATGGRPSCVDEEKAVTLAERRFEEAQLKAQNTKRWMRRLEEQVFQYKGLLQACNHSLDVDVVEGLAWLDRMIESLEAYVALAPPVDLPPVEGTTSVARPMGMPETGEPPAEPEAAEQHAGTAEADSEGSDHSEPPSDAEHVREERT